METRKLFREDAYLREFGATVLRIEGNGVVLDKTCFYPQGGGQVGDTGEINGAQVIDTQINDAEEIAHVLEQEPAFSVGEAVHGRIDWARRYRIMRLHSAAHVSYYLFKQIFGRGLEPAASGIVDDKKDRTDWVYSERLDPAKVKELEARVNEITTSDREIRTWSEGETRFWETAPFPRMKCGGTHVRNASEIGAVRLKRENKGKGTERIEISLASP